MGKALKITPKQAIMAAVVVILILLVATCQWRAAEERRRDEEIATAEGLAQVMTAAFAGRTDLKVADISGTVNVTSVDRGLIFDSKQTATLPFTVDYFLDLSKLNPRDARFDQESRTLFVELPDVRVAPANIDWTKGKVDQAEGFWVSRSASANLVRRALVLTQRQAEKTANSPENLNRAKEEARTRVQTLLEFPLNAVGDDDVRVVVRFPQEGIRNDERWDASRSIEDVLAERP